jgi:AraC family transcriptional regulator of adaptative response/methylated-DNA-[protein]-cysteine methyltransferase
MQTDTCLSKLQKKLSSAIFIENNNNIQLIVNKVFSLKNKHCFELWIEGTSFQIKVWQTLLQVPYGQLISYESLAQQAGYPQAVRAVASAVARNPVAYLVPCHRIVRKNGDIGNYRWGKETKEAIIKWENKILNIDI